VDAIRQNVEDGLSCSIGSGANAFPMKGVEFFPS